MKYRPPRDGIWLTVRPRSWPAPPAGAPGRGEGRAGSAAPGISASRPHHEAEPLPERQVRPRLPQQQHAVSSARRAPGGRDSLMQRRSGLQRTAPASDCADGRRSRWWWTFDKPADGGCRVLEWEEACGCTVTMRMTTACAASSVRINAQHNPRRLWRRRRGSVPPPASVRRSTPVQGRHGRRCTCTCLSLSAALGLAIDPEPTGRSQQQRCWLCLDP